MVYSRKRLALCLTLIGILLAVIWGNSLLPGELSKLVSGWFGGVLDGALPDADLASGGSGHGLLRKAGHLAEFFLLGLLLSWLVRMCRTEERMHILLPLAGGLLVGCVDECIQFFVPGRACRITDVGIDTLGCALGIVLITLIQKTKKRYLEETKQ